MGRRRAATDDWTYLHELRAAADDADFVAAPGERVSLIGGPEGARLDTVAADRVVPGATEWLWPERIPLGALTAVAGDPGAGKSLFALDLAARVSRGAPWPDGSAGTQGSVLVISAEDAVDTTIIPRLAAAGADLGKVRILRRAVCPGPEDAVFWRRLSLSADIIPIADTLLAIGDVRLVVIDPASALLGGHGGERHARGRATLAELARLARTAIVAVTHLKKAAGGKALYRLTGPLDFAAAARAIFLVLEKGAAGATQAAGDAAAARRLLIQVKSNLGRHANGTGHAFAIACDPGAAPRLAWEADPVALDFALLADNERAAARPAIGRLGEAMAWLALGLAPRPMAASAVMTNAEAAGIQLRTLERAARALGVAKVKDGLAGGWLWSLAPKAAKFAEDRHVKNLAAFENCREISQDPRLDCTDQTV
jgi:putative DNA primase/helicase